MTWMLMSAPVALAAEDDKKDASPAVRLVNPLAAAPGEKLLVRLRGDKLGEAAAVRASAGGNVGPAPTGAGTAGTGGGPVIEIKNKGKADGDDAVKKQLGDEQVEVEFTVPADASPGDALSLVVSTPQGDAPATPLRVIAADQLVKEAEPNGGLRQPQAIAADRCVVRGAIGEEKDVDVYRIAGKTGQTLRAEVLAAARGSMLDASLAVYDARGRVLLVVDDSTSAPGAPATASRDPSIEFKFPADGDYFLVVTDANDKGSGSYYPYLLTLSKS
jgi:hypothetical protein